MTYRRHLRSSLVCTSLCASLCAIPLPARGAGATPLAQSLSGDAKRAYQSARLLFEDGDHQGALAKFAHAYELSHQPQLLWNMAVCEKELRHYARTASLIASYLKEAGERITSEQRKSALETQKALRDFYAGLELSGVPDGATIFVDGTNVGAAPLSEPLLVDLGTRTLRVEQPGFAAFEKKFDVAGGRDLKIAVKLKPTPAEGASSARLSVMTSGEQDIVAIDGKVVGSRHWEGPLRAGEHLVRVTAAHKKTYEAQVQLSAGATRSLQISLEDEGHGGNTWLWIAGGAVAAAGATLGGYFLFKPKDAPGPHPEGKLATVYLSLRAP